MPRRVIVTAAESVGLEPRNVLSSAPHVRHHTPICCSPQYEWFGDVAKVFANGESGEAREDVPSRLPFLAVFAAKGGEHREKWEEWRALCLLDPC